MFNRKIIITTFFCCFIVENIYSHETFHKTYGQHKIIDFIDHYQPLSENTGHFVLHSRTLHATINAFNKKFKILAVGSQFAEGIASGHYGTEKVNTVIFVGRLIGHPKSKVHLYEHDGSLFGVIEANDDIYHLEYSTYLRNGRKAVMYRESQLFSKIASNIPKDVNFNKKRLNVNRNRYQRGFGDILESDHSLSISPPVKRLTCKVELVLDFFFYLLYDKKERMALGEVKLWMMRSNEIFEKTDFDGEGGADHIGLRLAPVIIYKRKIQQAYLSDNLTVDGDILSTLFTKHKSTYCLQFLVTSRVFYDPEFDDYSLGSTYTPDETHIAGICSPPVEVREGGELVTRYLNLGVMTNIGKHFLPLARIHNLLTLAHEIGHSFGARHDKPTLRGYPTAINMLMASGDVSPTNLKDVYITKEMCRFMYAIILRQGACFEPTEVPECGNAIVEEGEECDCGSESDCNIVDPCCTSPNFPPGHSCRRRVAAVCDSDDKCCTHDCQIRSKKENYECNPWCYQNITCDGQSSECPQSNPLPRFSKCGMQCGGRRCRCDGAGNCVLAGTLIEVVVHEPETRRPFTIPRYTFEMETLATSGLNMISDPLFRGIIIIIVALVIFIIVTFVFNDGSEEVTVQGVPRRRPLKELDS